MLLWPGRERKRGWKGGKGTSVPIDAVPSPQEAQGLFQSESLTPQLRNLAIPALRDTGAQVNVEIDPGEDQEEGEDVD